MFVGYLDIKWSENSGNMLKCVIFINDGDGCGGVSDDGLSVRLWFKKRLMKFLLYPLISNY